MLLSSFLLSISYCLTFSRFVSKLNPFPGMRHLDVAGGTGQLYSLYMQHLFVVVRVESLGQGAQELDET